MSLGIIVSVMLLSALVLLAFAWVRSELKAAARRRDRRERYRRAGQEAGPAPLDVREVQGGMSPERAKRISAHAEATASAVANGRQTEIANPHPVGSREFVLWEATYLSAMSDFAELREDRGGAGERMDP